MNTAKRCLSLFRLFILPACFLAAPTIVRSVNVRHTIVRPGLNLSAIVLLAIALLTNVSARARDFARPKAPLSLTAVRLDYNKFNDEIPRKSTITLNELGIKAITVRDHNDSAHDVLNDKPHEESNATEQAGNAIGILAASPCLHGKGVYLGDTVWRSSRVQSWHCRKAGSITTSRQFFSLDWKLVVLEELANGDVAEIRDIRVVRHESSLFKPDEGNLAVPLAEFRVSCGQERALCLF